MVRGFVPQGDRVHDEIREAVSWRQGHVYRYERWVDEPRLGGWQRVGEEHPAIEQARTWLSTRYGVPFDGSALAWYRDGRDSVGLHRDREMTWLEDTVIGVLTLGARRPFLLRRADRRRRGDDDLELDDVLDVRPASGDLLVLGGRAQVDWLHGVPRLDRPCGSRISVQWRWTSRRGRPDTSPKYSASRRYGRR